jgi:hypothetical protein
MPRYHARILDLSGRPTQATVVLQEKTDFEAIETVEQFVSGRDIELRQNDRLVALIDKNTRTTRQSAAAE